MLTRNLLASAALAVLTLAAAQPVLAADPNITGMWAIAPADGGQQQRQPPAPFLPEVRDKQAKMQKINEANGRLVGEDHTKCPA